MLETFKCTELVFNLCKIIWNHVSSIVNLVAYSIMHKKLNLISLGSALSLGHILPVPMEISVTFSGVFWNVQRI